MERPPAASAESGGIRVLDAGFDGDGQQRIPAPSRITGELPVLDALLSRSGCRRAFVEREYILQELRAHPGNCNYCR